MKRQDIKAGMVIRTKSEDNFLVMEQNSIKIMIGMTNSVFLYSIYDEKLNPLFQSFEIDGIYDMQSGVMPFVGYMDVHNEFTNIYKKDLVVGNNEV